MSAGAATSPALGQWHASRLAFSTVVVLMGIGLFVTITLAVAIGPVQIPFTRVWQIAFAQITGQDGDWSLAQSNIVWHLRFPRVLLGGIVGAGLAAVGVSMQAVVRNPLADPYILGISSGAAVGAVLVLSFGVLAFAGAYAISIAAFAGSLLTFLAVFTLARIGGQFSTGRLILSGVACAYVLSGVTSFITLTSDKDELARSVMSWMLGSVAGADWLDLSVPALVLLAGTAYLLLCARPLNALLMGEETAATLGVDVVRFRRRLFLVMSLLTGVMVAVSGAIGFVGLVVPHIARMLVGTDHRRVLPVAVLFGAIFLIWVDVGARMIIAPSELPVGVITSLLGGPFFIWLLATTRRKGVGNA